MLALKAGFCFAVFFSLIYKCLVWFQAVTSSFQVSTATNLAALSLTAECIRCYYCNSANNTACLDVNMYDAEIRPRIIPIVDCSRDISGPAVQNFFCRKIVQTVFHPHRDSELRVTRGCGWVPHERECYKDDNSDHLGTYCQCFDDLCNSAETAGPAAATVLFLLFAATTYLWSGL